MPINIYYFDGNGGITDPDSNWTDDANAFDGDETTFADPVSRSGSESSNYLQGIGTTAPSSGGTITQVRSRIRDGSSSSSWETLSAPTGGWSWSAVQNLEIRIWFFSAIFDGVFAVYESGDAGGTQLVNDGITTGISTLFELEVTSSDSTRNVLYDLGGMG